MPVVVSTYRPPFGFSSGHLQTVWAAVARRVPAVAMQRERIETEDGDFLDLDIVAGGIDRGERMAILSHGLEGSSQRRYMRGMARSLARRGWNVVAWNCRGCSGRPNRLLRSYHSGATEDLQCVVEHVAAKYRPQSIALVGFSLGGNLTLKYLGERSEDVLGCVQRAAVFSVPCDLASSALRLAHGQNRVYMRRFLRTMVAKLREKDVRFPGVLNLAEAGRMRTFAEFDERFTAPLHGFASAAEYWRRCSSRQFLDAVRVPTLIVNARDDPFLAPACFPIEEAGRNPALHLEMPAAGGHVGFVSFATTGEYWSETRAAAFLDGH